jgi:hypothetical protein
MEFGFLRNTEKNNADTKELLANDDDSGSVNQPLF